MGKKRKIPEEQLSGSALIRETNRRIRLARTYWDAHKNGACRMERERALKLYERLTEKEKEQIPQVLRCLLYTSPSPRDKSSSRMPSSA